MSRLVEIRVSDGISTDSRQEGVYAYVVIRPEAVDGLCVHSRCETYHGKGLSRSFTDVSLIVSVLVGQG